MGQEILYCYKCQTRLLGSEFEKGKAFKVGGKAACPVCVKDLLASMPEAKTDTPPKISTSGRILLPNPDSSSKFKAATVRATAPAPDSSKNTLIVAAVVGAVVILILIAMAMGSGRTPVTRNDPLPNEAPPPPIVRPDPPPPPAPAPSFSAELREINDKVRAFLDREEFRPAAEFLGVARRRHPETEWTAAIDEQTPQVEARARRAALAIRDKSLEAKKRGDDAEVKRLRDLVTAWGFPSALAELDKPVAEPEPPPPPAPAPAAGPLPGVFGDALGAGWLNHSWDSTVDFASTDAPFEGSRAIAFTPKKKYAGLFLGYVKPFDSRQYPFVSFAIRPAEDNLYVAATVWDKTKKGSKLIELGEQGAPLKAGEWRKFVLPVSLFTPPDPMVFAFVLQTTKTATQPLLFVDSVAFLKEGAGEKPPAELDAYRARWSKAAAKAARRDYAGAQKELEEGAAALKEDAAKAEAAADLELLKLASQVASEAAKAVERWTKGQKVKFDFLNAGGDPETAEGTLLSADALRLSVQRDGGAFELPASELSAASLAEIFRGRADRKPTDARAAAAFCAFEGDADAARKQLGDGPALPDKLLGISKERPAAEAAARRLFWTAEAEFLTPKRRFAAIEKFSSLVSGDATAFAARLRPYVAARLEAAKDTVFLADDLSAAGTFTMSGGAKIDACWTSTADSAAAKAKENYVEAEFHVFPGTAYRAWLWAAACCQETFDYSLQGSELSAPNSKNPKEPIACEPGGDAALPGRIPSITLRKYHAQHGGPKEPARWEWIPLTLPKYETSGPRKLRVLTNQQGFTVAAIVVSAVRRETPREAEMKDLEKARFGIRRSMNTGPLGFILHEYWLGIEGVTVDTLVKHPSYSGKPSGTGFRDSFEGPKDLADNYGSRMRGYVHPTVSGNYTFWIASDDGSELWVSGDDTPARKRLVCGQTMAAGFREWTKYSTQKSQPVPLTAGKRYYVECLHKEGGVGDHISVGWTLPDGSEERPIPGSRLSPWSGVPPAPGPAGAVFYRAANLNGPATVIDGRRWDGKGAKDLAFSTDGAFENQNVVLNPPTDDARAAMIRSSAFSSAGTAAKFYGVPPGTYLVYAYFWEDNNPEIYDIFVQGKEVLKGYNSGPAGHWDKLGPYPAVVTEGVLEVHTSGGHANFSGLEVWKSTK